MKQNKYVLLVLFELDVPNKYVNCLLVKLYPFLPNKADNSNYWRKIKSLIYIFRPKYLTNKTALGS